MVRPHPQPLRIQPQTVKGACLRPPRTVLNPRPRVVALIVVGVPAAGRVAAGPVAAAIAAPVAAVLWATAAAIIVAAAAVVVAAVEEEVILGAEELILLMVLL